MKGEEMPLGFSFILAQNPDAMQRFSELSEEEKKEVINRAHSVRSKQEMHKFVKSLEKN